MQTKIIIKKKTFYSGAQVIKLIEIFYKYFFEFSNDLLLFEIE